MNVQASEENTAVAVTEGERKDAAGDPPFDRALLEEMLKAGVVFGRRSSKTNPRMEQFIEMTRNGIELFSCGQVLARLDAAGLFLEEVARKNGTVLCVGTTPAARDLVTKLADAFQLPRVTVRWLGGTLTNFPTISKRIQYYLKLRADREAGRLERYTKKEQAQFAKEIEKLTRFFSGLERLTALPQALLVVNASAHATAIREARRLGIPVVAIVNSDANPDLVTHPIPGNDAARSSISWFIAKLELYLRRGKEAIAPKIGEKLSRGDND